MGPFSFLKYFKPGKFITPVVKPDEYVPAFWENDYCQVEIVPFENKAFLQKQAEQIDELAPESNTGWRRPLE